MRGQLSLYCSIIYCKVCSSEHSGRLLLKWRCQAISGARKMAVGGAVLFFFWNRVFADAIATQKRNKIHLWVYFTGAGKLRILLRWKIQSKHLRWASLLSWQRQAPTNWLYCTSLVLIKWLTAWGTKEATELQQSYWKCCTWLLSSSFSWHFSKNTE